MPTVVTWYGGDFVMKELRTYWVMPAGKGYGILARTYGLEHGLQRRTVTQSSWQVRGVEE